MPGRQARRPGLFGVQIIVTQTRGYLVCNLYGAGAATRAPHKSRTRLDVIHARTQTLAVTERLVSKRYGGRADKGRV
jgi:hypothetical protein